MDSDEDVGVKKWLTIPGRLLLIVSIIGTAAVFVWYVVVTLPGFPPGSYPIWLWLAPTIIGGVLFFSLSAWILETTGIKVFRRHE